MPLVLVISFLVLFLIARQLSLYVSEATFYKEVQGFYEVNHLLESGVVEAMSLVKSEPSPYSLTNRSSSYPTGKIFFTFEQVSDGVGAVLIECETLSGHFYRGRAYFQYNEAKIIRWVEYR
ncbi:competence type IV pilus minor pilin ComGG [Metabacillus iocasae]|uniref:Competence protein ComG n=1 Tax=Priestia iocasae TaxID=2291674 RepID=A0ABS2QS21_9BACI|nr:competence type IV pilus minor pilin ComGG [Metabacillus iocasae]MBM7701551.1 hypothetical protein [Metabacillus iocasae]